MGCGKTELWKKGCFGGLIQTLPLEALGQLFNSCSLVFLINVVVYTIFSIGLKLL